MVSDEPNKYDFQPKKIPHHPLFFNSKRWHNILWGSSYYFAADTISTLRFDTNAKQFFLCIRCHIKNYDNEIENFIDWLNPYIDAFSGDFLGFSRYEESENPTIIRKKIMNIDYYISKLNTIKENMIYQDLSDEMISLIEELIEELINNERQKTLYSSREQLRRECERFVITDKNS